MRVAVLLVLFHLVPSLSSAQSLERQPYIQSSSETGATVCWMTSSSASGELRWGTDPAALTQTVNTGTGTHHEAQVTMSTFLPRKSDRLTKLPSRSGSSKSGAIAKPRNPCRATGISPKLHT